MDAKSILAELRLFADCSRSFSLLDALDSIPGSLDREGLRNILRTSDRVFCISAGAPADEHYIWGTTLLTWYMRLNMRLAQCGVFRLSKDQFTRRLSALGSNRMLLPLSKAVLDFGLKLGLVTEPSEDSTLLFPVARIMSLMSTFCQEMVVDSLKQSDEPLISSSWFKRKRRGFLKGAWSDLDHLTVWLVAHREGLTKSNRKLKLAEIGDTLRMTRERVRQIEQKFWNRLECGSRYRRARFAVALIADLLSRSGRVTVEDESRRANWVRFVAKCAGVACAELRQAHLLILGVDGSGLEHLLPRRDSQRWLDEQMIVSDLLSTQEVCLSRSDARLIVARLAKAWRHTLAVTERVRLSLCKIGRPTHYTRVTEMHNRVFPEFALHERNIHAALGREECGIVWIGVRGTYALREWGYERPTEGLYDTVAEIVRSAHRSTGKPVPWNVILAEMGRHRRIVNRNSVVMATCFNPQIQKTENGLFVPRGCEPNDPEPPNSAELDRVLREFGPG